MKGLGTIEKQAKRAVQKGRICLPSAAMFLFLAFFSWLNEIMDLPHLLLGAPRTPINWREASIETVIIVCVGLFSVLKLIRDMTELERAEKKLRKEKQFIDTLIQASPAFFVVIDAEGKTRMMNESMLLALGYSQDQISDHDYLTTFVPECDRAALSEIFKKLTQYHEPTLNENRILASDGRELLVEWHGRPVFKENGQFDFFFCVGIDITERKRAEQALKAYSERLEEMVEERTRGLQEAQDELIRKEKLAVMGQLAGGLAHELRNPLGTISNAAYLLDAVLSDADKTTKEYLELISSEVSRSEKIISDLLGFSRSEPPHKGDTPITELVAQALERHPQPDGVELFIDIPDDLPSAFVDPGQIEMVLANLVINAYQAMSGGGKLTIKCQDMKGNLSLTIADTGCGISKDNMKKLFDPLYTTKPQGVGLGLTVSKNLTEANSGSIEVKSEEGVGSTFIVNLPIYK